MAGAPDDLVDEASRPRAPVNRCGSTSPRTARSSCGRAASVRSILRTRQRASGSRLVERSGLGRVSFDLAVEDGAPSLSAVILPCRRPARAIVAQSPRPSRGLRDHGRMACRGDGRMARAARLPLCRSHPRVMRTAIWLLLLQASLGAFDTLYYHEYRLKLAHSVHTRVELRLHASRDFAYAIIIGSLGFRDLARRLRLGPAGAPPRRDLHHALGFHRGRQDPPAAGGRAGDARRSWASSTERFWPS